MILEAVSKSKSEGGLVQETDQTLLEKIRKLRGEDLWKPNTAKMARTKDEMSPDDPKGGYSRVPGEIWDMR